MPSFFLKQDLSSFSLPDGFRGRSAVFVQFWWLVQSTIFGCSPQFAYGFRNWILRLFGAKVGKSVIIRPSVRITYPWKVEIGDYVWIGDNVELYSLGHIFIGNNSVISQRSYLCSADHDFSRPSFPIQAKNISISDQVWVASDVFIAPGVSIGEAAVIGARSSVFSDMPSGMVCMGSPCKPVKARTTKEF